MSTTLQNYVMPSAMVGDPILYYAQANDSVEPSTGYVAKVDGRAVDVHVFHRGGMTFYPEVHHMTDPLIRQNEHIRAYGGWKINPRFETAGDVNMILRSFEDRFNTTVRELKERVERMEKDLGVSAPKPSDLPEQPLAIQPQRFSPLPGETLADQIRKAADGKPFRRNEMADKLGTSADVIEAELTGANGFTYSAGWYRHDANAGIEQ